MREIILVGIGHDRDTSRCCRMGQLTSSSSCNLAVRPALASGERKGFAHSGVAQRAYVAK
jgi:hypothetical protein